MKKWSYLNFLQTDLFEVFISTVVKLRLTGSIFRIAFWHTDNNSLSCSRKQHSVGVNLICLALFRTNIQPLITGKREILPSVIFSAQVPIPNKTSPIQFQTLHIKLRRGIFNHQPEVEQTELDPETMSPLQKAVIQGFQYRDMLESGKVATVSELAQKVKQERAFLFRALSLVNLAPDIIEAILNGKELAALTLSKLRKGFPEDWTEQRKMFGME